ncbi:NHLP bacteriocin system secretion protein [Gammaproteobacteria bacterium]
MDMKQQIFRKVSLERLSSPEQLDLLMRVIRPSDWFILGPLIGLLMVVVAWGWFGSIPTKVSGKCILINPTGLVDVASVASGRLMTLLVKVGDRITVGQELGQVALPELSDRIEKARERFQELKNQGQRVRSFAARGSRLNTDLLAQQRQTLEAQKRSAEKHVRLLQERVETQARLLAQGLITNQSLLGTRQELNGAENEVSNTSNQLAQLNLKRLEAEKQSEGETTSIEQQIEDARRQLDSLLQNHKNTAVIDSPFAGRVVEIKTGPGMLLSQGAPVLTIEQDSDAAQALEAAIYVPAGDGKRVANGMIAQVTPATVKREEYGYMLAKVHYVSEYPSSLQSIQMLLQNETVVKDLAGQTPPIEIRAVLQPAANVSGFVWSSAAGAPVRIRTGTLCAADIVVSTQRPVSLVIPVLKKSLGVD